jgi:hypothetical protein
MAVDPQDRLREIADLWSAPTADALHRVLVLHPPVGEMADAFEPYFLLSKHHEAEPEQTLATAVLLLTDARWRKGASHLVRRIADGGLLGEEQLDLLSRTFLVADDAVYWTVPADWFATEGIEITLDVALDEEDVDVQEEDEDGPVVARRELAPPLRRWAASRELAREPATWAALLARARELSARHGAAVMAGMLDLADVLGADARELLIKHATTWPHHDVRLLAFELIAERDSAATAHALAHDDPNAKIRAWAATLARRSRAPDGNDVADPGQPWQDKAEPPALF